MPIELHTWALAWVLSGQLHTGTGLDLHNGLQRLEMRYIPTATQGKIPERSMLAYQIPQFSVYLGNTPMGPGCFAYLAVKNSRISLHQNQKNWWLKWQRSTPFKYEFQWSNKSGWNVKSNPGPWAISVSQRGPNTIAYGTSRITSQITFSNHQWQTRVKLQNFYAIAGGGPQWDYSSMGVARKGHFLELRENHSLEGLNLQIMASMHLRQINLFGWYQEGIYEGSWMGRLEAPISKHTHGQIQWGSNPWIRQISISYKGNHGRFLAASIHSKGYSMRFGSPRIHIEIQKDRLSFRLHYRIATQKKNKALQPISDIVIEPKLRIHTLGTQDHPVIRCLVEDEKGHPHIIHLLSGEDQWKTHLPPGRYTWKTLPSHQTQGYMLQFESPTFLLETNQTTVIKVIIEKQPKDIFWIGGSPST